MGPAPHESPAAGTGGLRASRSAIVGAFVRWHRNPLGIYPPSERKAAAIGGKCYAEVASTAAAGPLRLRLRLAQSGEILQVLVRDNNVEQAMKVLKKKLQREGVFREMKQRRAYEKPSERKTREKAEAVRRSKKAARKAAQREGLLPAPKKSLRPDPRRAVAPSLRPAV